MINIKPRSFIGLTPGTSSTTPTSTTSGNSPGLLDDDWVGETDQFVWGFPFASTNAEADLSIEAKKKEALEMALAMASMLDVNLIPDLAVQLAANEAKWMKEAEEYVRAANGDPVLSDLLSISGAKVRADSKLVSVFGFDKVMTHRSNTLRFLGATKDQIADIWKDFPELSKLLNLMEYGQDEYLKEGFVRNGSKPFNQSTSYRQNRLLCNHHLQKMTEVGRTLIITLDAAKDVLPYTHFSPMLLAVKPGEPNGRLCNNLTHGRGLSVNSNIDTVASDAVYPLGHLPNIGDIAEIACIQKDLAWPAPISGATVDVWSAYNQTVENAVHSRLTASQVQVEMKPNIWEWCVIFFCCMIFGFTRAGHAYVLHSRAIDFLHNKVHNDSVTYIDDGMMINRETPLVEGGVCTKSRMLEYVYIVKLLFGPKGSQLKKQILWEGRVMVAIGWLIDLNYEVWRVSPKPVALIKIYAALFVRIPVSSTKVSVKILKSVVSLLRWYTVGLPLSSAFLSALNYCIFCKANRGLHIVKLSVEALSDLDFLRAIITYARINVRFLGCSINHLRTNVVLEIAIYSDASSTIGAGSFSLRADVDEMAPGHTSRGNEKDDTLIISEHVMRWTKQELEVFAREGVSINVLELFAMIFEILMAGDSLRGRAVRLYLDNTSAVSWFNRMRAVVPFAVTLMQILCVYCGVMDIGLFPGHIAGVENIRADSLSRLDLYFDVQDFGPVAGSRGRDWWAHLSREDTCRQLLLRLAIEPLPMPTATVLRIVKYLLPVRGFVAASL